MMISDQSKIRITYGDTDKMGVVYYGNYPKYYEIGRTELMRKIGFSYDRIEKEGVIMPVVKLEAEYFKSAYYDDLITVNTIVKEMPKAIIRFYYEIYNDKNELINKGYTDLSFVKKENLKPCRPPANLYNALKEYF